jgi:hypothetical protein
MMPRRCKALMARCASRVLPPSSVLVFDSDRGGFRFADMVNRGLTLLSQLQASPYHASSDQTRCTLRARSTSRNRERLKVVALILTLCMVALVPSFMRQSCLTRRALASGWHPGPKREDIDFALANGIASNQTFRMIVAPGLWGDTPTH